MNRKIRMKSQIEIFKDSDFKIEVSKFETDFIFLILRLIWIKNQYIGNQPVSKFCYFPAFGMD